MEVNELKLKIKSALDDNSVLSGIELVCALAKYIYESPGSLYSEAEPCKIIDDSEWITINDFMLKYPIFDDSVIRRHCMEKLIPREHARKKGYYWLIKEKPVLEYLSNIPFYKRKMDKFDAYKNLVNYN